MFANSFVDASWTDRHRRGWTTLTSFALQVLALGALLLCPLISTQSLPLVRSFVGSTLAPPPAPPRPAGPSHATRVLRSSSNFSGAILVQPPRIPDHVAHVEEDAPPPALNGIYVANGTGDRWSPNSVLNSLGTSTAMSLPLSPQTVAAPHRPLSRLMEGNLVHKVQPQYPPLARTARIEGSVVLQAVIGKDGRIEGVKVLSGHPLLVKAAVEAVRQWRYRPYYSNGEAVEVETQVTVNFILSGG
jgi:protein TonB